MSDIASTSSVFSSTTDGYSDNSSAANIDVVEYLTIQLLKNNPQI